MQPHFTTEFLQSAASALAAGRLLHSGLAKRYPAIVSWLIYNCIAALTLASLAPRSIIYFWIYVAVLPIDCIFSIFAVRELFSLIFGDYPGIRTVGRWAMYGSIVLAVSLSLLATRAFWGTTATGRAHSGIYYLQVGHRSVVFGLAIIILSLLFSISRYPLDLSRNAYISSGFFGAVFLSQAAQSLIDSFAPRLYNNAIDQSTSVFVSVCLVAWAYCLSKETATGVARVSFHTPSEDHLLHELTSLNNMLSRAARR